MLNCSRCTVAQTLCQSGCRPRRNQQVTPAESGSPDCSRRLPPLKGRSPLKRLRSERAFSAPSRQGSSPNDRRDGPTGAAGSENRACSEPTGRGPIHRCAAGNPSSNGRKPMRGRDARAAVVPREEAGAAGFARLRRRTPQPSAPRARPRSRFRSETNVVRTCRDLSLALRLATVSISYEHGLCLWKRGSGGAVLAALPRRVLRTRLLMVWRRLTRMLFQRWRSQFGGASCSMTAWMAGTIPGSSPGIGHDGRRHPGSARRMNVDSRNVSQT
jgi:hypothetical protein